MTTEFPQCAKCEQRALYAEESDEPVHDCPDCECADESEEFLKCAACGHRPDGMTIEQEDRLLVQAKDARDEWEDRYPRSDFLAHWRAKLKREREKVARLREGRW